MQGLTIGSISVITRAIFSDILSSDELVKMGTIMGSFFGIGPMIGSYLTFYYGYLACFDFFAISVGVIMLLIILFVPETHFKLQPLNFKVIKANLSQIIHHSEFMAIAIIMGLVYSLIINFHTIAPFIVQEYYHKSAVFYGNMTLVLGIAFLSSTFVARFLLTKYSVYHILYKFLLTALVVIILGLIFAYIYSINITLIVLISAIMFFSCGSILPLSMGRGISFFRNIAGNATAMLYLINISIPALVSFILSLINIHNPIIIFINYFILILLALIIYLVFLHNKRV